MAKAQRCRGDRGRTAVRTMASRARIRATLTPSRGSCYLSKRHATSAARSRALATADQGIAVPVRVPIRTLLRWTCLAAGAAIALFPRAARAQCVDDELKEELVGGRHYRGVQERLFTKAFRHEFFRHGRILRSRPVFLELGRGRCIHISLFRRSCARGERRLHRFRSAVTDSYDNAIRRSRCRIVPTSRTPLFRPLGVVVCLREAALDGWQHHPIRLQRRPGRRVTDDSTSRGITGSFGFAPNGILVSGLVSDSMFATTF